MPETSRRESDDSYAGVIAQLNTRWRVIVCKDGIQWILQQIDGKTARGMQWRGVGYFRTSEGLVRSCGHSAGEIDAYALAILHQLPRFFP